MTAPTETTTDVDAVFDALTGNQHAPDDPEMFSHYAKKDDIIAAEVHGQPIRALCGKVWTPKRNPEKYPVCPECADIYAQMSGGE